MLDFIRLACAVPEVRVADVQKNTEDICRFIEKANEAKCDLVVFPELAVTGYTCQDLFFQSALIRKVGSAFQAIASCTEKCDGITVVVGAPVKIAGQLYNCGVVFSGGYIRGIVPKTYLPNYSEFYEKRWFTPGRDLEETEVDSQLFGFENTYTIPVGVDLLFSIGDGTLLGVEICEDIWSPLPPSSFMAVSGAEVIVNLSASDDVAAKRKLRRELVLHQSAACTCAYVYCSAGETESTQDAVFSGHSIIAAGGNLLGEREELPAADYMLVRDADLGKIRADRCKNISFHDCKSMHATPMEIVNCGIENLRSDGSCLPLNPYPFIPLDKNVLKERCDEVFSLQVAGLKRRLSLLNTNAVIGVSGGLDSTLALLVCVEAMRQLGRPASDVYGVTMPCFGTSDRTYQNALNLMEILGVTTKEINIRSAVTGHFADIGHDINVHNTTYENAQARERTQILMDYAGVVGGLVVGTGDLSESALGWCTYNGDHMSMYSVNGSVPKTLIPEIISYISEKAEYAPAKNVLLDVVATPISPELLPPDAAGNIRQQTEDIVGPYALHDFFLYHVVRYGFTPTKIYHLATRAFAQEYDKETVKKWLKSFYHRFFSQQFKRNAVPDGVAVGSVGLNPRSGWRMPSDAFARLWLDEVDTL